METKKSDFHKKYIKSKEFQEVRNAVLERDGHRCVLCHRTENLVCHHTSYRHLGEHNQNEIDDCITLCQLDHINHHRAKYNIYWYSVDHPRNNDLKEIEVEGNRILVGEGGFYDAVTFKKYRLYSRGGRKTIIIDGKSYFCDSLI